VPHYRVQSPVVLNEGIGGEIASVGGIRRFRSVLLKHRPDIVLLMEGTNDLLDLEPGANAAMDALRDMVLEAKSQNVRVGLATIPPQRSGGQRNRDRVAALIPGFNDRVRALAAAEGVALIEVFDAMRTDLSLIGIDDLHPTERGYQFMADVFSRPSSALRGPSGCGAQECPVTHPTADAAGSLPDLTARVRAYWNNRIHDLEVTTAPVGTRQFFDELDEYRFDKLSYLPQVVDFNGFRQCRLLEVGCGVGTDLVRFARGGARVVGLDLSETAVGLARQNLVLHGQQGDLLVGDGAALPVPDESLDVVYAHGVLQYAPNPHRIVEEAHRVLKPAGTAIFMVYNRVSWLRALSTVMKVGLEHEDAPVLRITRSRNSVSCCTGSAA
jgi:SAM-dependent methyltransferase